MKTANISLLGCGWLGYPLATSLLSKGFHIKGSTTTTEKLPLLEKSGIYGFEISITEDKILGDIKNFLSDSQVLIIDIPPKVRGENPENYTAKIRNLIPYILEAKIPNVLFISSTSVYGNPSELLTEESPCLAETESGRQLLECEALLLSHPDFNTTVIRFGGLIGEQRHPVKQLSGKTGLQNPDSFVHLIHLEDCIGIIEHLITIGFWGEILNAVAPANISRESYYTAQAKKLGLIAPEFDHEKASSGKHFNIEKLLGTGYLFRRESL